MVELKLSKLMTRVRFPSPAPNFLLQPGKPVLKGPHLEKKGFFGADS